MPLKNDEQPGTPTAQEMPEEIAIVRTKPTTTTNNISNLTNNKHNKESTATNGIGHVTTLTNNAAVGVDDTAASKRTNPDDDTSFFEPEPSPPAKRVKSEHHQPSIASNGHQPATQRLSEHQHQEQSSYDNTAVPSSSSCPSIDSALTPQSTPQPLIPVVCVNNNQSHPTNVVGSTREQLARSQDVDTMMECDPIEPSLGIDDIVDIARSVTNQIVTNVANTHDRF